MKLKELKPYVTAKGGVVILNGPFPIPQAERVAALCAAAHDLLCAAEWVLPYAEAYSAQDEVGSAEEEAERDDCQKAIIALRAAITKATGREL